jgi:S1-C subfamily serine protease/beta-glucanase (GH16 family)
MATTLRLSLPAAIRFAAVVFALSGLRPAPPAAVAQQGGRPNGDPGAEVDPEADGDDANDRDLPFNTDRLFVPRWRLADGPQVRAAFRSVVERARAATVVVTCDGKRHGLGGVVGADGWVLTKATPLCQSVVVTLADGRQLPGVMVGMNGKYDLALLKIDAAGLPTLDLTDSTVPPVGAWLATVGLERDPVTVGVVSVPPREIPPQPGRLGIMLSPDDEPVVVEAVPEGAAAEGGVHAGDRILSIEGQPTRSGTEIKHVLESFNPGDVIALIVDRGGESLTLRVTLQGTIPGYEGREEFQNNLGGRLSVRRFGFPLALQHDSVLRPNDCGGPVVDLDGRVVGFNIARAGRTESFTIPTSAVRDVLRDLMSAGMTAIKVQAEAEASAASAAKPDEAGGDAKPKPADAADADATAPAESLAATDDAASSSADNSTDEADADEDENDGDSTADAGVPAAVEMAAVSASQAAAAYEGEGYRLVWADEFNQDGRPDSAKWTYERGFVRNEELQWYRPDNARCQGGQLVIEARRERIPNPRYRQDGRGWQQRREYAEYTSASLLTRGLADWQYGRFEMRGRIDVRRGLWPAWWTLGHGAWPAAGEIDMMEYYRGQVLANAAWAGRQRWQAVWDDSRTPLAELGGDAWADDFHVWRMDWDADRIAFYLDGRLLNDVDLAKTFNAPRRGRGDRDDGAAADAAAGEPAAGGEAADDAAADPGVNPFRAPHYMILNLAIGGTNGGDPGDTEFPGKFEVDYVRVYQRN